MNHQHHDTQPEKQNLIKLPTHLLHYSTSRFVDLLLQTLSLQNQYEVLYTCFIAFYCITQYKTSLHTFHIKL